MKPSPLDCLFQSTTPTPASVSWILRNRVKQPRRWWTIAGEATPVAVARGCVCSYAEFTDASLRLHYTTCPRIPYSPERSFARVSLEIYSRCHVERRLTPVPVHAANPTTKNSFLKPEIERERGREREREREREKEIDTLSFVDYVSTGNIQFGVDWVLFTLRSSIEFLLFRSFVFVAAFLWARCPFFSF